MNFTALCRYCHNESNSPSYTCSCKTDPWISAYRTLYIEAKAEDLHDHGSESFHNYSLNHCRGMLQHTLLPNRDLATDPYPTVGLTPLYQLDNLSRHHGAAVHIKKEGDNPSGCFKDRETMMCLLNSKDRGNNKAVIYSSGNAAASAAYFSKRADHDLVAFVPGDTYTEKIHYIRNHSADVIVIGNNNTGFEDGYELFSRLNREGIFDDRGYDNWSVCNPYRVEGDKTMAIEIVKQLSEKDTISVPDFVLVPTANGSCLAGIWKGFKELYNGGLISELPKMVSVGIDHANPVAKSVRLNETVRPVQCTPSQTKRDEVEVGSIIVAEKGYDSMEAAEAVIESGGEAMELYPSDIQEALVNFLELEGPSALEHHLLPEPAGLTSLAGIDRLLQNNDISSSDTLVSIATGDGLKAKRKLHSLITHRADLQEKVNQIMARKERLTSTNGTKPGKKINIPNNLEEIRSSFLELQNNRY